MERDASTIGTYLRIISVPYFVSSTTWQARLSTRCVHSSYNIPPPFHGFRFGDLLSCEVEG